MHCGKSVGSCLLTLAACCLLLSGCRQQTAPVNDGNGLSQTQVSVAAAADLKFAFDELIADFEQLHPHIKVQVTYGSSGNFFAQFTNRAPFDIYFSADAAYPRQLAEKGLADQESLFLYAVGQIVVWVPHGSSIDVEKLGIQAVVNPAARKVAIANPLHAPYGRAAEAAMKNLGVFEQVQDRLVLGENIAQTAQFVESGAADVGIIALSLALAPALRDKGKHWLIPIDSYPTMEQGSVILNWASDREATDLFRTFVAGPGGRKVLKQYGFILPGE
jgi:molybdate transport system substrate-binding protein